MKIKSGSNSKAFKNKKDKNSWRMKSRLNLFNNKLNNNRKSKDRKNKLD